MSSLCDFLENKIINAIFRDDPGSIRPAELWAEIVETLPGEDGTGGDPVAGVDRLELTQANAAWKDPAAATQGGTNNLAVLDFGEVPDCTIVGIVLYDAETGGNVYMRGALTEPRECLSGDTFKCPIGAVTFTLG